MSRRANHRNPPSRRDPRPSSSHGPSPVQSADIAADSLDSVTHRTLGAREWARGVATAWDRFWFTPRLPHLLSVLRIFTGLMLLYSHVALATDLMAFIGPDAWINDHTARGLHDGAFGNSDWGRTYLWHLSNPLVLWLHHAVTIAVTACFAAGLLTRITAPLAWLLQVMLVHRLTGALFGLDQIATYSAMYLMLSPCGSWISVDAWIRKKLGQRVDDDRRMAWLFPAATPSVAANVATRLFQLHLCVIYLFGGLAKARGTSWWDGTALWYAAGNYEYQSLDMTWISKFPRIASSLTLVTLFWEISYAALVWPRLTRPIVIAIAVCVHAGIAIFLGMLTFGSMMIAANMIFVRPEWMLGLINRPTHEKTLGDPLLENDDWDNFKIDSDDMVWDDDELELEEDHAEKSSIELGESISDDFETRVAKLDRDERKLRAAAKKLRDKSTRIKGLETKYRERVSRLKEREARIKALIDRRRKPNGDV